MQCEALVLPSCNVVFCFTSVIFSVSTVLSSPTVKPSNIESLTIADRVMFSTILPAAAGSAAQNTMLPPAPTGAIWNLTVVVAPAGVCTVTVTSSSTTCRASPIQMSLGIAQLSPLV